MNVIRETVSLCPECLRRIPADLVENRNKIYMHKKCPEHGFFSDLYWGDYELYKKYMKWFQVGEKGVNNPNTKKILNCPYDCGLCPNHKTSTLLANIDVTNRCNLNCPVCFANANKAGYLYEPTKEEIIKMLDTLANQTPARNLAIQFSGGEPTIRDDIVDLIRIAKEKGFKQVQIATNGFKLASDLGFCRKLGEAGLCVAYLSFDGVTPEPHISKAGFNTLPAKLKAIENIRKANANTGVVLVPVVIRGVNDSQLFDIVRLGIDNLDIVRAVNFQPISFVGRVDKKKVREMRITIPDVLKLIEEQSDGTLTVDDFYPVPAITAFVELVSKIKRKVFANLRTHPICGAGAYLIKDKDKLISLTELIDIEMLFELSKEMNEKGVSLTHLFLKLPQLIKLSKFSKSREMVSLIKDILMHGNFESTVRFHNTSVLFIGIMHFMDAYNFDLERSERCCIHYAVPGAKVMPFCSFNTIHRPMIEKKFSKELVRASLPAPA